MGRYKVNEMAEVRMNYDEKVWSSEGFVEIDEYRIQGKSLIDMIKEFDILLVEGLKTLPLPRIAIFRGAIELDYIAYSEAIAIDDSVDIADYDIPSHIDILDLNNTAQIIEWIEKNAKEV